MIFVLLHFICRNINHCEIKWEFCGAKFSVIFPVNSHNGRLKNVKASINILLLNFLEENGEGLYRCSANNTHGVDGAEILFIGMTYCLWRVVLYSAQYKRSTQCYTSYSKSLLLHIYNISYRDTPLSLEFSPHSCFSQLIHIHYTGLDNDNLKVSFWNSWNYSFRRVSSVEFSKIQRTMPIVQHFVDRGNLHRRKGTASHKIDIVFGYIARLSQLVEEGYYILVQMKAVYTCLRGAWRMGREGSQHPVIKP